MHRVTRRDSLKWLAAGTMAGVGIARSSSDDPLPNDDLTSVDVLVCGAGPAGVAAAWMAAQSGVRTLLVERYGRLGGMAVQAMVGPMMGDVRSPWVERILKHIGGRRVDYEFLDIRYAELLEKAGCQILLHAWVVRPFIHGRRVIGVQLLTKQGMLNVRARITIDATGDGDVAWMAGAEFDQGRDAGPNWPADGLVQPMTIMFRASGIDHAESMEARGGRSHYRFPDGRTWNEVTKAANAKGELPASVGMVRTYLSSQDDQRIINATQINRVDGTRVWDLTKAELEGRRQVPPILAFLRKNAPGFQNAYVSGMPAVIGVRETRRIRGLATLTLDDLINGKKSPHAVVQDASNPIDIHNPDGIGQAQGISEIHPLGKDPDVKPYDIPYGCLVPQRIQGLLVAGRCISGSHEALASYRVQVITMATGIAVGVAAAQAASRSIEPADVDVSQVQRVVFV